MSRHTYEQVQKMHNKITTQYKQSGELIKENIKKIQNHKQTKKVTYKNFKKAFDYVDGLFPNRNVKDVVIYICDRQFLNTLGYKGIGGFFERVMKTIVIPDQIVDQPKKKFDIVASVTRDEVIVHELLHYVSDTRNQKIISVELEEEFAYGNSIGYLKSKKYSNDEIIRNVFLPFLVQIVDKDKITREVLIQHGYNIKEVMSKSPSEQKKIIKKYQKDIYALVIAYATKRGKDIIDIYSNDAVKVQKIDNGAKKFEMLDLDD